MNEAALRKYLQASDDCRAVVASLPPPSTWPALRGKYGLSQTKAGEFVGCDQATWSTWERRMSAPSRVYLPRLARLLEILAEEADKEAA
jgi:DNA-binding transcriptional regulator YiaG